MKNIAGGEKIFFFRTVDEMARVSVTSFRSNRLRYKHHLNLTFTPKTICHIKDDVPYME